MKNLYIVLLICVFGISGWAQEVRVYITDAETNEPIENVTVSLNGQSVGTSDAAGRLNIPCRPGEVALRIAGYAMKTVQFKDCGNPLNVKMEPSVTVGEVAVEDTRIQPGIELAPNENAEVLNRRVLQQQTGLFLEESMNRITGVRVEKRTASGGQRITIRGYGNTERFNGYGYRAYLNGIPVTDAEGVTILDDIDPSLLQNIAVIKGPNSTRYGNGIAGAVLMETLRPVQSGPRITEELTVGSFGLLRSNTRFENRSEAGLVVLNYGHQSYDSYRVHSTSSRDFLTLSGDVNLGDDEKLTYYLGYHRTDEELAGQLDSAEFFARENVGEDRYLGNDARVQFEGYRAAIGYHRSRGQWRYQSNLFVTQADQNQSFAVGLNRNSRAGIGSRNTLGWISSDGKWNVEAGAEVLFNNSLIASYGYANTVITGIRSDAELDARNLMGFAEVTYRLTPKWFVSGGLSATQVRYSIDDRLRYDTTHVDGSGTLAFDWQPSPRIRTGYDIDESTRITVSWSRGFAAPTSSNIVIAQIGEVNTDLKPEIGNQWEVGVSGRLASDRLRYSAEVYQLTIDRKLTSEAITDTGGTVLYTRAFNAGAQDNLGVEISVGYDLIRNPSGAFRLLNLSANYSYSHHRYRDFHSDANNNANTVDYSGNPVSGVPPHVINVVLQGELSSGLYFNAGYQYVDEMPINFTNDAFAPAFGLLNVKAGYRFDTDRWMFDAFVGGQNLTGALHYNMVVLNQVPRGGVAPKVFLPGPYSATFFGGIKVSYKL